MSIFALLSNTGLAAQPEAQITSSEKKTDGTDCTYSTSTNVDSTKEAVFTSFGFSFQSGAFTKKTGSLDKYASLQSISITTGTTNVTGTATVGDFYLLVYEGKGNPSSLTTLVGSSSNFIQYDITNIPPTTSLTFNFEAFPLLDTSKEYTFVFSTSKDKQTGLDGGETNPGIRMNYNLQGESDNFWVHGGQSWQGISSDKAITGLAVKFNTVPEPTTATFGLLSLGLLALRRRRY
ncbi:MAG: PEP-CTERM sorting domain-containing protein [Anaerovoracaceae bacterium]